MLNRRYLVGALGVALAAFALGVVSHSSAQDRSNVKAQVQRSEARSAVTEAVDEMAASAERQMGTKFTTAEKAEMVDSILRRMEGEDIYAFVE